MRADTLPDHLVCPLQQRRRNRQAEGLGRLEVDHQLELGRLQYRQLSRLGALQDASSVDSGLTIRIGNAGAVAHQAAERGELTPLINRRNPMECCERDKLVALAVKKGIAADEERTRCLP